MTYLLNLSLRLGIIFLMYVVTTAPQFSFANEMPLAGISANGLTIKDDNNIQIKKD
jgi:hypothetical protein